MSTEDQTQEETEEETGTPKKPDLIAMVKGLPSAPDQAIIDSWKAKYRDVFVSGFSETEIYIWRAVTRSEYKKIQIDQQILSAKINQIQQQSADPKSGVIPEHELALQVNTAINSQFSQETQLVVNCLLWPKLTAEELEMKAGTVPTLQEQIMQNSNFMTPQQASLLVMKL